MKILMLLYALIMGVYGMAIKFNTSNLSSPTYATYDINEFNGVDYTTTPTNVSDTRAIDISNYVPEGNSLVKRNGWAFQGHFIYNDFLMVNIFELKGKYVFLGRNETTPTTCAFFIADDLEYTNGYILSSSPGLLNYFTIAEDYDCWAFEVEDRLFIFTGTEYLMIYYDTIETTVSGVTTEYTNWWINDVENFAYTPTIAIGVQDVTATGQSASSYEEFNMLSNNAKIELVLDYSMGSFSEVSSGSGTYYWGYTGMFDLTEYFANFDSITLLTVGGIEPYFFEDSTWFGIGIIEDGTGAKNKVGIFHLVGKKLYYEIASVNSSTVTSYTYDEDTDTLTYTLDKMVFTEEQKEAGISGLDANIFEFEIDNSTAIGIVNGMRFGILYGASTYRDTLFASGNSDYSNMDIHTCFPKDKTAEAWEAYTYFGDMSYHRIGSSSSAIIGYGINADSSLMILKETVASEPNVWFRTGKYVTEDKTITLSDGTNYFTYTDAYVMYQVFPSAINIKCDTKGQIMQFNNGVLINSKDGIYYVNVSDSTSASSYEGVEVSYLIRENLGSDISEACMVAYKNKIYVAREDVNGDLRVYIADKNRYTYNESKLVYEWWVLDNIPAKKFFVFDDTLYFTNDNGLYKFVDDVFYDYDMHTFSSIEINTTTITSEVYFDTEADNIIISSDCDIITACVNSSDPKTAYQNLRDYSTIKLSDDLGFYWKVDYEDYTFSESDATFEIYFNTDDSDYTLNYINTFIELVSEQGELRCDGYLYTIADTDDREYLYSSGELVGVVFNNVMHATDSSGLDTSYLFVFVQKALGFYSLMHAPVSITVDDTTTTIYPDIEDCVYKDGEWIYIDEDNGIYYSLGTDAVFNYFSLSYNGIQLDYETTYSTIDGYVYLYINRPVTARWLSKYNALGRLDYLKTTTNIYFVPDARRGGYTRVGYRTYKKDTGYYTNSKVNYLDFDDIDFDDFTFGQTEFGRTFSSKKKIKNFSFIQMIFYSNEDTDSTLVACSFRYKYSKNNKGVK